MSFPQNRKTIQPCFFNSALTSLSRSMLRSIFGIQNSWCDLKSCFLFSQLYPCQNSLSQNTAIFLLIKTISGFPQIELTFFRYRNPLDQSSLISIISIFEPLFLTAFIFFVICSGVFLLNIITLNESIHYTIMIVSHLAIKSKRN